jgi:protein-tyrosine phosphatase
MSERREWSDIEDIMVELTLDGVHHLSWSPQAAPLPVTIYAASGPDDFNSQPPAAEAESETRADLPGLPLAVRHYFRLVSQNSPSLVVAPRLVPLESTFNFRDLGGYRTSNGQRVKWGRIFRSDALSRLTDADREYLKRMGLKMVCDLRSRAETEKAPDLLPEDGSLAYLHLPIQTGEMNFVTAMEKIKKGDASWLTEDYMVKGYLKNLEEFPQIWGEIFHTLLQKDRLPLVFHCTGGKDRAGTCAALFLSVLGVPDQTIVYDHQLSNLYIAGLLTNVNKQLTKYGVDPKRLEPYFTAPLDGIKALLAHLRHEYGSAENYLVQKARLTRAELAQLRLDSLD